MVNISGSEEVKRTESSNHKFTIDYKVTDKDVIDALEQLNKEFGLKSFKRYGKNKDTIYLKVKTFSEEPKLITQFSIFTNKKGDRFMLYFC